MKGINIKYLTYPKRNISANLRNAELIKMGKGYFANKRGKRTIASHCSPLFPDLSPAKHVQIKYIYKVIQLKILEHMNKLHRMNTPLHSFEANELKTFIYLKYD